MWTALKALFTSKTTWLAVGGSAVVVLVFKLALTVGVTVDQALQLAGYVAGLFGIKGIQQGMADWGKNAG